MEIETNPSRTEVQDRSPQCELCGATMSDLPELATHMEGHAEKAAEGVPPPGPGHHLKCTLCESSFETAEQVKAHLGTVHRV